jgi:outer membrane protein assembly factor BamD (BamD/ComL family)
MSETAIWIVAVFAVVAGIPTVARGQERLIFDEKMHQWVAAEEIEAPAQGVLGQAKELIAQKKFSKAEKLLKKHIKSLEDQPQNSDRRAAMLLYGDVAFKQGQYYKANDRYQRVINEYPQTEEWAWAIRHDLDIARAWLDGKKRRLWGIFQVGATDEALDILSQIEQLAPRMTIAEAALRMSADYYYHTGQFELAELKYRRLLEEYKSKPAGQATTTRAKYALLRRAYSSMAMFPGIAFDITSLIEASDLFKDYLGLYPGDAGSEEIVSLLRDIESKRAQKEYRIGEFYVRIHRPGAAAYYFKYVTNTWPDTLWGEKARTDLAKMGYESAAATAP